ncbi:hypothetical protein MMC14_004320 [Varicellaria rhodocarpa]|nr:hypothetical protein [Varicellaria rhodocarpa]
MSDWEDAEHDMFFPSVERQWPSALSSFQTATGESSAILTKDCVFCYFTKPLSEVVESDCASNHAICHECIRMHCAYCIEALRNMPLFRCLNSAHSIQLDSKKEEILGKELMKEWEECREAIHNPDQLYCSTSNCWKPLALSDDEPDSTTNCWKCGLDTCISCKKPAHPGKACGADDDEEQATIEMAKEQGWMRCFRCRALVERSDGCNHIEYSCGVMFCILCGKSQEHCGCRTDDDEFALGI